MADVKRYATSQRVIFAVPADYVEDSPEGAIVITEADHLAALERVRVETLRDAREAVAERFAEAKRNNENGYSYNMLYGEDVFPAIDRLISAATTGDTDD